MKAGFATASGTELPRLLFGLAAMGFRGAIPAPALSSLVAHANDVGVGTVLAWVEDDPGLLALPSWQFFYLPGEAAPP